MPLYVDHVILEERERAVWDFYAASDDPESMIANFVTRSVRWNDAISQQAADLGMTVIHQDGTKCPTDLCDEIVSLRSG